VGNIFEPRLQDVENILNRVLNVLGFIDLGGFFFSQNSPSTFFQIL
jgi:hypothetical protein